MLMCITRPKKLGNDSVSQPDDSSGNAAKNHGVKSLASQIKDMALKSSGAYKYCATCTGPPTHGGGISSNTESDVESERLKGISSGEGTSNSGSEQRREPVVLFVEENEPKEWVAQVEPGVLITLVSLPRGGNDLKRIRFRYVNSLVGSDGGICC
ncbi:hypothetical protein TanjilG_14696 [Lupinus angustifolius]|uniref:BRX domain-containing protein n=1 Tax=Lupinus angustifolius TaxID=3871 RepID=A0A1J7GSE9_LUPAN|nr:hypothetical protein TanjilG_14696 [Lupinus angustifolius]